VLKDFNTVPQPAIVISMKHLKNNWVGFGYFPGKSALAGDIDIDPRDWFGDFTGELFNTVILHEFGHALGLEHSPWKHSTMHKNPKAKGIDGFTIDNINKRYEV